MVNYEAFGSIATPDMVKALKTYNSWFKNHCAREPASLLELAQFLDDERNHGQFPDNPAVNGMFRLARDPTAIALFEKHIAALVDYGIGLGIWRPANDDDEPCPFD
jgi:hypothetical protein